MEKILLIDDEEDILRVLSMSLESDGYTVITANSGESGIRRFKEEAPHFILTDLKMPGIDGFTVLKEIKKLNPDAEVIIITGHGDVDAAIEALQHGASDFIQKPVKDEALSISLTRAREKIDVRRQLKAYTDDLETMVKIATEEFERKSNFQSKLIRSSNDGIVATDEEWQVIIFNPGAEKIFGYRRSEVIQKTDARGLFPEEVVEFLNSDTPQQPFRYERTWQEITITAKDGEQIPVRFSGTLLWEKKQMIGSVAFFQDLREIKRLEQELVTAERLAAVGQTVAGMAHCIKNILHGFKGGSYLMDVGIENDNSDKLNKGWQMIQRQINRTSDLVLDLLSFSKQREPEYEACVPNDIIRDVCELMQGVANDYQVAIIQDFSPDIGEVIMDPQIMYRCILNLVTNAIDACMYDEDITKKHNVRVTTRLEVDNFVRFEVQDNGCGMDEKVLAKLFSALFSTKGSKGTGLGLLVTQKLVEEHLGTIDVSSEPGKGTTFTIRLPFQNAV
jgi:two-component system, NtrC family, sensor kinase